jgi:hypothetical protein
MVLVRDGLGPRRPLIALLMALGFGAGVIAALTIVAVPYGTAIEHFGDRLPSLTRITMSDTDLLWWLIAPAGALFGAAVGVVMTTYDWRDYGVRCRNGDRSTGVDEGSLIGWLLTEREAQVRVDEFVDSLRMRTIVSPSGTSSSTINVQDKVVLPCGGPMMPKRIRASGRHSQIDVHTTRFGSAASGIEGRCSSLCRISHGRVGSRSGLVRAS